MIGNKFSGPILPLNDGDPTHISGYGKGGLYTSVDTTTDRDNIPVSKREHGMIVAVGNSGTDGSGSFTNYQLIIQNWYALDNSAKLTALADNSNWKDLIQDFIKNDGSSIETTGNIKVGETLGLVWGTNSNTFIQGYGEDLNEFLVLQTQNTSGSVGNISISPEYISIQATNTSMGDSNSAVTVENGINGVSFINNGYYSTFDNSLLNQHRNFNLPNQSGIIALTSDVINKVVKVATATNYVGTYNNGASGVGATLTATSNVILPSPDSVGQSNGDRILLFGQTTPAQNGIWYVTSLGQNGVSPWVLTRATDSDSQSDIFNSIVYVKQGSTYANTLFLNQNTTSITIGTTGITYAVAGGYTIGSGLTLTNKTLTALPATNTITRAMLSTAVGTSVIGRSVSSTGVTADISASTDGQVLKRSAGTLIFDNLTIGELASISSSKILGNSSTSSGIVSEISIEGSNGLLFSGSNLIVNSSLIPYLSLNNIFSATQNIPSLQTLDSNGTSWRTTLSSSTSGILDIGSGWTSININNAVAFNSVYGLSGQILQSNGSGSSPNWTTPTSISRIINNIAVDTTAGNALYTDYIYIATAVVQLTLPTAINNSNMYTFKNGFTSNCTVVFTSGQNADGSTSIIVTPNQSLSFVSDNSNYKII